MGDATNEIAAVLCRAGGSIVALPTEAVREVLPIAQPTRLPGAPPALAAVIAHRGSVVPVVDLGPLLGVAPTSIVAGVPAVLCDAVGSLMAIAVEEVLAAAHFVQVGPGDGVLERAILQAREGSVPLLDPDALFRVARQTLPAGR